MGLIRAALSAAGTTLADQWKEYFYCESIANDVLMVKGQKRVGKGSSNTKGNENIISNGSVIAVAAGQCMMIVEQGKVVEFCSEEGEFVYDTSTEPSIFNGNITENFREKIGQAFNTMGKRFTFGGDAPKDQRVYYFNMKEILDNKFGTQNPVPFRVVDTNIGLDIDIAIRCNGMYSYTISNPIVFYTNIAGNVSDEYKKEDIDAQLKSEFLSALQPAFAKISMMGIRYSLLPAHTTEISNAMNEVLTPQWAEKRGISISVVSINSVTAPKEDEQLIKDLQKAAVLRDPSMAAATLVSAQGEAMKSAASNENGAMMGFMGMGMAQQAGGMNAQGLFSMGQQQQQQQQMQQQQMQQQPMPQNNQNMNQGYQQQNMNPNMAQPQNPTMAAGVVQGNADVWTCSNCGVANSSGKFCSQCGTAKPVQGHIYKCSGCGFQPQDPTNPPKFCPECGNVFDENDIVG